MAEKHIPPALLEAHEAAIRRISAQVASFHATKTPYRIYHGGSTNTTRQPSHTRAAVVDTSALTHVLAVDPSTRTALVQPNVPMHALAAATLPHNLLAPATPEFPLITAGGAFAGTAGESSSFRHGFFDRAVRAVRLVLPDGSVVRATPAGPHADLFLAAVGACGSLGVAVELELALAPAAPFVRVTYLPAAGMAAATETLAAQIRIPDNDFVDAILYGAAEAVVVVGRFATRADADDAARGLRVRRFSRAWHEWFFLHARRQGTLATGTPGAPRTDLVPTADFLFRYARGAFWMGAHAFALFHVPFARATRALLGRLLRAGPLWAALAHGGYATRFVIQDVVLPFGAAAEFVAWAEQRLGVYPLWLCPIEAAGARAPMHAPRRAGEEFFLNVGIWGPGRQGYGDGDEARWVADNVALERKVAELQGRKWLYAQVFAESEEEFWEGQGIDGAAYEAVRGKYGAGATPSVFDKVRWKGVYGRTSKVRGLLKVILGRDAVLKK